MDNQILAIDNFFMNLEKLRSSFKRLEESRRLVYERRYHKQYEKAKSEFITDSTNYSILSSNFKKIILVKGKENWKNYIEFDDYRKGKITLQKNKELTKKNMSKSLG